jgi:hypothetical protein
MKNLVRKCEWKRQLRRPVCRWEANIKMWNCGLLLSGSVQGPVVGSYEHCNKPFVFIKGRKYLDKWRTTSFSRTILSGVVSGIKKMLIVMLLTAVTYFFFFCSCWWKPPFLAYSLYTVTWFFVPSALNLRWIFLELVWCCDENKFLIQCPWRLKCQRTCWHIEWLNEPAAKKYISRKCSSVIMVIEQIVMGNFFNSLLSSELIVGGRHL